jgi:hypothetical protein
MLLVRAERISHCATIKIFVNAPAVVKYMGENFTDVTKKKTQECGNSPVYGFLSPANKH